ncbi:MAG: peptidase S41, partial [Alphaproteobacteria bacterium]
MKLLKIIIIVTLSTTLGFFGAIAMAQKSILSSKSKYNDNFLEEVMEKIRNDYVDEKTPDQLYEAAASGILNSLDPHSSFLNTEDLKEMTVHTKGEFG